MAVSIVSTLIKGLSEAAKSELADTTDLIIEGDVTKRTKLATLADWIKGKLGIGTASSLTTTSKELVGAINELNTKNNPLNAIYIASNFDSVITGQANENAFAFGHSDALNGKCGYWVIVFTMGSSGRFAQIAVGALGMSNRFYDADSGWTEWK